MALLRRTLVIIAALAWLSPFASAYYYWIYFAGNGAYLPVPVKFDLRPSGQYGLQNNTVAYFISDQVPGPLLPGDSFEAIVSQIRAAAEVWNGVSTSRLRLTFGGISSISTQDFSPGIDIVFDDNMPPGLIAQSKPLTVDNAGAWLANGATCLPIVRSRMQLRRDFTAVPQASSDDAFFTTLVHEFGHTLGLQHTLTSSVMSTAITRGTTKSNPLGADDIAGVSLLYPANGFLGNTGSVAGTVSLSGAGVNMASVVALSASGATAGVTISALTNPDGTYRIDGLPPGQYYVYAHPLPPPQQGESSPANIDGPRDIAGNQYRANIGYDTQFLGGTRDFTQTSQVTVNPGNLSGGINFNMQQRPGPAVYDMQTYGYPGAGQVAVPAPPLQSGTRTYVVFNAPGTVVNNNQMAPGLAASVIGGTAQIESGTLAYYQQGYLYMVVDANSVLSATPTALAVTVNSDLYVLPSAFTVVPSAPPSISAVTGSTDTQGNATVAIAGSNLGLNTRILFDGAPAQQLRVNPDGSLVVAAPPASGNFRAKVEALAPDGQTSSQLLGTASPPVFAYNAVAYPSIGVSPSTVTAGIDTMVQITGYNTNFVASQVAAGFGSSDITVKRVWVVSPGLLLMNVSVSPTAPATLTSVSVANGLQLATLSAAFQIQAANPGQMSLRTPILNQATNLEGVPLGGVALINTSGMPGSLSGWVLTISDQPTTFSLSAGGLITAAVPTGLLTGPQVLRLISPNGDNIPPVLIEVDPPPPMIQAASNGAGVAISASNPVNPGDSITLLVAGLADVNGAAPAAATVHINVGGVDHIAASVVSGPNSACLVQFVLAFTVPTGPQPATLSVGNRLSAPYLLNISTPASAPSN